MPGGIRKIFVLAAIIQLLWASAPSLAKFILTEMTPEVFASLRYTISGFTLLTLTLVLGRWKPLKLSTLLLLASLGICCVLGSAFLALYGLKLGGVVNFALTSSIAPLWVGLLSTQILGEKLEKNFFIALALYVPGAILVVYARQFESSTNLALSALVLISLAYLLETTGTLVSKRFRLELTTLQYLGLMQIFAAAAGWIFLVISNKVPDLNAISFQTWVYLLFVSLVCFVFCNGVWLWILKRLEGHRLGFFSAFHTLAAGTLGVLIHHEQLNALILVAALLLLVSVWIANRKR